jgi:hypothetical protein
MAGVDRKWPAEYGKQKSFQKPAGKSHLQPEAVVTIGFIDPALTIGFIDPALEASENVSKNRFAFGNSVFSDGVGL